jgi:hypothetical protein
MATPRKRPPKTPGKIWAWSSRIKSYGLFYPLFWSSASRPPLHLVANPKLL